ncbi:unnamed protein product, partial [Prorocentrum cordatum]
MRRTPPEPWQRLVALAEAKHSCGLLYDDLPKLGLLLEFLDAHGGVLLAGRGRGARREVWAATPPGGSAELEVHYVLEGSPPASLREVARLAALPAESGRMLRRVAELGLRGAVDLGEALQLAPGAGGAPAA